MASSKEKLTIEKRVNKLEKGHESLQEGYKSLQFHIQKLDADVEQINAQLAHTAKKTDIESVKTLIAESMNGVLRDALNAVPQKAMAFWTAIVALVAVLSIAVPFGLHILHI